LLEKSRAEEKHSLTNLIDKLEQEFSDYRTDSEQREESIRGKFSSKEKKIKQEL
jgi:flagellar capping protein FliD